MEGSCWEPVEIRANLLIGFHYFLCFLLRSSRDSSPFGDVFTMYRPEVRNGGALSHCSFEASKDSSPPELECVCFRESSNPKKKGELWCGLTTGTIQVSGIE